MSVKTTNIQVSVTLTKDIVDRIDAEAKSEMRTRSKQIAKMINDYYAKKEK